MKEQTQKTDVQNLELINGVTVDVVPSFVDARGSLFARDMGAGLPFVPKRFFVIQNVPEEMRRGNHAHRECHQLLICLQGRVECIVDNGRDRAEYCLDAAEKALHIPPMTWGIQRRYYDNAILLVAASHAFDAADYIHDYAEFKALCSEAVGKGASS